MASGIDMEISFRQSIAIPQLEDDDSYTIGFSVRNARVVVFIDAATSTGILRGFSVLQQLIARRKSDGAFCLPVGLQFVDRPHHSWRGLLVDVARHFHPLHTLKTICDGLEFARMNVLHLHLVDDQGWRMESFKWPLLHQRGNHDGQYLRQSELRELVAYCAEGGVRIVPELAMPSHSGAALFAYPELAPDNFPRVFERTWGIHMWTMDPSLPIVGTFVRDISAEMAAVFPDDFLHIGGDEVSWPTPSGRQQAWLTANDLTLDTLQAYFTRTIALPALEAIGRKPIGWNEAYQSAEGTLSLAIQWWQSAAFTGRSTRNVLSTGYYLDYVPSAQQLYLDSFMQDYDEGGEACAWTEFMEFNLLTRVFPGILSMSEVLWRNRFNRLSVDAMQRRMYIQEGTLAIVGPDTAAEYTQNVARLLPPSAPDQQRANLELLVNLMRPSPVRASNVPLDDVLDAARPNSAMLPVLTWLASEMLESEEMNPTKPATIAFTGFLSELSLLDGNSLPMQQHVLVEEVRASALLYLAWIRSVQTGHSGIEEREAALATGTQVIPGFTTWFRYVVNGLKTTLEPVLLARDMGPFNYDLGTEPVMTTAGNGDGDDDGTQPTSAAPVDASNDNSLAIGLSVGLGVALFALVAFLIQFRRSSNREAHMVAYFASSIPLDEGSPNRAYLPSSHDEEGESYASYLAGDGESVDLDMAEFSNGDGAGKGVTLHDEEAVDEDDFSYLGGGGNVSDADNGIVGGNRRRRGYTALEESYEHADVYEFL